MPLKPQSAYQIFINIDKWLYLSDILLRRIVACGVNDLHSQTFLPIPEREWNPQPSELTLARRSIITIDIY